MQNEQALDEPILSEKAVVLQNMFLSITVGLRFQLSLVFRPVFKTITSTFKWIRFQAMSRTNVDMTSK